MTDKPHTYVGLDMGGSQTRCLVAMAEGPRLRFVSCGSMPPLRWNDHDIRETQMTSKAVLEAVCEAEHEGGLTIYSAVVGVGGSQVRSNLVHTAVAVPRDRGIIDTRDVGKAIRKATGGTLGPNPAFLLSQDEANWQLDGLSAVRQEEIHSVFAADFGRSLVSVDPTERLGRVTSLQWVRSARVARVWPNKIAISVEERVPIAFLRIPSASSAYMIDSDGVILDVRMGGDGSLPVLTGIDAEMPIEDRLDRIRLFEDLVRAFGETDLAFGRSVSEVNLSDADNAVVLAMHGDEMVELQMGDRHLQHRLDVFLNYIDAWRSEFGPVASVDLRFEKQVALKPVQPKEGRG